MAIDPRHAKADKADAPDTAQDKDAEANLEPNTEAVTGWTFEEIGRRFSAADDISDVPVEFWVALGMENFCSTTLQMARLITYAHSLNLLGMKGMPADKERRETLAEAMGTTTDTLFRIVDQAIQTWEPTERKISTALHGEYVYASGEGDASDLLSVDGHRPETGGKDTVAIGADLDVEETIKAIDKSIEEDKKNKSR